MALILYSMQNFASPLRRTCKDIPRFFGRTNGLNSSLRFNSTQVDAAKQLNWPEYFEIRRRRRQWQTVSTLQLFRGRRDIIANQVFTIPCALVGFFGGSFYFGSLATDPTKPIMVRRLGGYLSSRESFD